MADENPQHQVKVAKIGAIQAIGVALITAVAGVATGYLARGPSAHENGMERTPIEEDRRYIAVNNDLETEKERARVLGEKIEILNEENNKLQLDLEGLKAAKRAEKSTLERIKNGEKFFIALTETSRQETDCLKPEKDSPVDDFLLGAVYKIEYNKDDNKLQTSGLNQGKAGCPWEDHSDARTGTDLDSGTLVLWGGRFSFDENDYVYYDGRHVGYILFPPN